MHLDEGAGLLDGEHSGLELLRIGGAAREALHGGGGGGGCFRSWRLCVRLGTSDGLGLQAAGGRACRSLGWLGSS